MHRAVYKVPPNDEAEIMKLLQGSWRRADEKISFVIEGESIKGINGLAEATRSDFLLDFNEKNKKWQLTACVFGDSSAIINLNKDAFTIFITDGQKILPKIDITEVFHNKVWFFRLRK